MTVTQVRRNWAEVERALAAAGEVIVTRNSIPVARIVRYGVEKSAAAQKRLTKRAG